ncbi:MAG: 50S ribosomal protein L35 [Elusimicrobiales bacterium]|nr:50S ribosomal protein L35 [Elusimicrobiales bacterium]
MPKMKTHSGAKKRLKITASGKIKWKKCGLRHLLTPMSASKGRKLRKPKIIESSSTIAKSLKTRLPYI